MTPLDGYRAFHAPRYRYLLDAVERYLPVGGDVLDVGLSPFTDILRRRLGRPVDTLGLETRGRKPFSDSAHGHDNQAQESKTAPGPRSQHFQFDLNTLGDPRAARPALPRYALIVFAEVMEHLHTSPLPALTFFRDHLVDGGVLVVQTPNAASLGKRLKLLAGLNPYEMIREDRSNPGHVREYTARELSRLAAGAGFTVIHLDRRFYFDARHADHAQDGGPGKPRPRLGALKNVVYSVLPPFLREGMTAVLRREPP